MKRKDSLAVVPTTTGASMTEWCILKLNVGHIMIAGAVQSCTGQVCEGSGFIERRL